MSQNSEEKAIVKLITGFELATAKQNVSLLEPLLNKHFRVTMNQLFGSTEVTVMDRSTYLQKVREKIFGGEKREISIITTIVSGNTAVAVVKFVGQKMSFQSILSFVKNKNGLWELVEDIPTIVAS